jgi:hypothetical protein
MGEAENRIKHVQESIRKNGEQLADAKKFLRELEKGEAARKKTASPR